MALAYSEANLPVPYYAFFTEEEISKMLNSFGIQDKDEHQLFGLICRYMAREGSPVIDSDDFILDSVRWAELNNMHRLRHPQNFRRLYEQILLRLSEKKLCDLRSQSGEVKKVAWLEPQTEQLNAIYLQMQNDASVPYPDETNLTLPVPEKALVVTAIDDLNRESMQNATDQNRILRINFQDSATDYLLIPPKHILNIQRLALNKLRHFLFPSGGRSRIIDEVSREMLAIMPEKKTNPEKIMRVLQGQETESPLFYIHLMLRISIQIKKEKEEKLQKLIEASAKIVYALKMEEEKLQKEQQVKEKKEKHLSTLLNSMKQTGGMWRRDDLYSKADSREMPWSEVASHLNAANFRLLSSEMLDTYSKSRRSNAGDIIYPEIYRLSGDGFEVFIHKENYHDVFLREREKISKEMGEFFVTRWFALMKKGREAPEMQYDDFFYKDTEKYLLRRFPEFSAMLAYPTYLYDSVQTKDSPDQYMRELNKTVFMEGNSSVFRAVHVLLGLNRKDLLSRARALLPIWVRLPLIGWILRLFLFRGGSESDTPESEELLEMHAVGKGGDDSEKKAEKLRKEQEEENKKKMAREWGKAIEVLSTGIVGVDTIEDRLKKLESLWNIKLGDARGNIRSEIDEEILSRSDKIFAMYLKIPSIEPERVKRDLDFMVENVIRIAGDNVRDQKSLRDYATLLALAQIRRKL